MQVDALRTRNTALGIAIAAAVSVLLTLWLPSFTLDTSVTYIYLLIELFTVFISLLVVVVSYHSLADQPNLAQANLLILGFTVVAICDLAHGLTYPGLPGYVSPNGGARTIFFRLMGRSAEVLTLFAVACRVALPGSRTRWLLAGIGVCGLIGWFGIFHIEWFPAVIRNGGQTPFKIGYEYVLAALNVGVALALWQDAVRQQIPSRYLLSCACILMAAGNVILAQYRSLADFTYTFGLFFKVIAYALVYRAAFVHAIQTPHRLLRESEQQLKTISDNLPGGMVYEMCLDPQGRWNFLYFSAGILRLTGGQLSAQDVMRDANAFLSRIPAADRRSLLAAQEDSSANMRAFNIVIRMQDDKGKLRHFHLCSQPRRHENSSVVWDGIAIDVTEREQIQTKLRNLNLELEERVTQRTAALTRANKRQEAFSYMVAHDLRAPVRQIDGHATLLQQDLNGQLPDDNMKMLASILSSAAAMRQMIDGILAISQLEHSRPNLSRVDLSELANQIGTELQASEPQRKVHLSVQPHLAIDADPVLIRNVLSNLMSNAWKFTAATPRAYIEVGTRAAGASPHDDLAEHSVFFVRDNGIGFAPQHAERIFDLFLRLPDHSNVAGHGIGLASVRSIIENHGGKVWAEGLPSQGATFYFSVPTAQPHSTESEEAAATYDSTCLPG